MSNAPGHDVPFQRGFTLVELITVMLIVGIIAVVAVPRFFDADVFQSRGTADQLMAALRYGQKVAVAQHRDVNVNISAAGNSHCDAALTGGNVGCVISDNVAVVPALPQTVTFDALGRRTAGPGAFTVGSSTTITIEAETGYVH